MIYNQFRFKLFKRNQREPSPPNNKTFGVNLQYLHERDQCEVPILVTWVCKYIKDYGLEFEGLFRVKGNQRVVNEMRFAFEKDGDVGLEENKKYCTLFFLFSILCVFVGNFFSNCCFLL